MMRYEAVASEVDCNGGPAVVKDVDSGLRMGKLTAIQSQLTVQSTESAWNAVVTTARKGTFLIRRLAGGAVDTCPLRAYEIRHIPEAPPPE